MFGKGVKTLSGFVIPNLGEGGGKERRKKGERGRGGKGGEKGIGRGGREGEGKKEK